MPTTTSEALPLVGILVQLGTSLLLTALVLSLRREARQHDYFRLWTWAWISLTAAIVLVTLRFHVVPLLSPTALRGNGRPLDLTLHTLSQLGKLGFGALVLLGTWRYARGRGLPRRGTVALAVGLGSYGILTAVQSPNDTMAVAWQAALDAPAFALCAWFLATAPKMRRGLGARVLTLTFALLAALWVVYLVVFGADGLGLTTPWSGLLAVASGFNAYVDSVFAFVLCLGMVVTVVQHGYEEADAARRAQLDEIRESGQRLAEILQAAHEGIVTIDAERRILVMNPAAEAIVGTTAAETAGQPFDRFLAPADRGSLWDGISVETRRSEAHPPVALRRETTGLRADGTVFPLELAISTFDGSAPHGYVLVLRDLTSRERERDERERLHQQVAQAARLEAVGRMVSGVAHELNNPLTAIMAFAQDLLFEARSEPDREALTVIVQQAQRCRVIVGDLLIFARNRRDERRRLAPSDMVSRVLRVFERDSSRNGVILDVDVTRDLPPADVDPIGIEQVLTNLLTNAFQAAPRGGRVTLRARARGDRLEFEVEDSGPGIPPDVMPRLFEPFFTTKEVGHGTGLGLSVSHSIVLQHGGDIRAENLGAGRTGARFVVSLPFVDRRSGPRTEGDASEPPPPPVDPIHRRVLVVDDEEAIRSAMRRSLERRGWAVDEAADGREALLRLEVGGRPVAYDAVVTDLRMPGMSGIELCEELGRKHPDLLERTVIITGDTASPTVVEFLARTDRPYLQKPFDMRALVDVIDRVGAARAP